VEGSGEPELFKCADGSYSNDAELCPPVAEGCDASQGQYSDTASCCAAFRQIYKDFPGYEKYGVCGAEPGAPAKEPSNAPRVPATPTKRTPEDPPVPATPKKGTSEDPVGRPARRAPWIEKACDRPPASPAASPRSWRHVGAHA
jgi:hypothetical protein